MKLLGFVLVLVVSSVHGHLKLDSPTPRVALDSLLTDTSMTPCAEKPAGASTATYMEGQTITVDWTMRIEHGVVSFVFSDMPTDADSFVTLEVVGGEAVPQTPDTYSTMLMLPAGVTCDECVLSIRQVSGNSNYVSCADVVVAADDSSDPVYSWITTDNNSACAAKGTRPVDVECRDGEGETVDDMMCDSDDMPDAEVDCDPSVVIVPWELQNEGTTAYDTLMIKVGQEVHFDFTSGAHDVSQFPDKEAYDNCDFGGATSLSTEPYVLDSTDEVETLYFGCALPDHCTPFGMKIMIDIAAATDESGAQHITPSLVLVSLLVLKLLF